MVADAIRRVGTPPFFAGFAVPPGARLDHPSRRYFVHLHAPGWNVIGATAPWLPGVSIGHNDRIAWDCTPVTVDTQDVYADKGAPVTAVFNDSLTIRGRKEAFDFTHEFTRHGVIVASDTEHDLVYTVRWSGFEAGGAAELAALALDRAQSWPEFRQALSRWKMPARRFDYQDVDGNRGFQVAALVPIRRGTEWAGWRTLDELPHGFTPAARGGRTSSRSQGPPRGADAAAPVVFAHPLGITDALRQRFHVGPLTPAGDARPFHVAFDAADWDRSSGMNAPGQSGSPASRHFSDLAQGWARGEDGDAGVQRRGGSGTGGVDAHARAATDRDPSADCARTSCRPSPTSTGGSRLKADAHDGSHPIMCPHRWWLRGGARGAPRSDRGSSARADRILSDPRSACRR